MKKVLSGVAIFSAVVMATLPANAENTTQQEFGAINKISSLCKSFSNPTIAVVYDDANAASVADKDAILGYATTMGKSAKAVTLANASSASANVVVLANGLTADQQTTVANTFSGKPVITASTDLNCVNSGKCVLGVNVGTVVELLVNSDVFKNAGLKFDPAFEFMVKKI